jgi:hypothetical protein
MTLDELRAAIQEPQPPPGLSPLLKALWLDARGDWNGAHGIAQDDDTREAAWVHAYLHRKEGDDGNAAYWYGRARRSPYSGSLDQEWEAIAQLLIAR